MIPCPLKVALALLLGVATTAKAAEPAHAAARSDTSAISASAASAETPSDWKVSGVTYVWLAGFKGTVGVSPNTEPVGVDLSFGEIFKHLKFVFMGAAEARHGRFILLGDVVWAKVGAEKSLSIRDRDFLSGSLKSKTLILTGLGGYRLVSEEPVIVDLAAGGRVNGAWLRLKLSGPNRTAEDTVGKTWVDPVIASRITADVAPKVSLSLYGDVGGFGVS